MPWDFKVYLEDIIEAINRAQMYVEGLSKEAFTSDLKTLDAIVRNLEIIGEAIKKYPKMYVRSIQKLNGRKSQA